MSDEDNSTPRSKRIKKDQVIVISSSSDSDSNENVGVAGTRRKKLRVHSAVDGNESSGSSVVFVKTRRRVSSFSSDSSEDNSDKCPICLRRFTSQEVGTPKSCKHVFCLNCILEWSKNVNTCPVDRKLFKSIQVQACVGGRVLRTEPVVDLESLPLEVELEDRPYCEVCDTQDYEENMMLCQRCDACYHMRCITPRLGYAPGVWFCIPCRNLDDGWIDPLEMDDIIYAERAAANLNSGR